MRGTIMCGPEYALLSSSLEQSVPDCGHSSAMNTERSQPELPFADAVHQLDAGDRGRSIAEPLEADHHGDALLDASVVLLNEVVEVFRRAQLCVGRQKSVGFQFAHRAMRRGVAA